MEYISMNYYSNRQSSLKLNENSTNSKKSTNIVVAKYVAPPNNFIINTNKNNCNKCNPKTKTKNPIRHYRKQLTQYNNNENNSNISINKSLISEINKPGGTITKNINNDCVKCNNENALNINEKIYPNNENNICDNQSLGYLPDNKPYIWKNNNCNDQNHVIKSCNTNLQKKYSTSNNDYLKNRCKTYSQNLYSNTINNISRDCSNVYYCSNNTNNNNNYTGNVNNKIGAQSVSEIIYRRGLRSKSSGIINNKNNNLCCDNSKILYKKDNNICKFQHSNNIILLNKRIICP